MRDWRLVRGLGSAIRGALNLVAQALAEFGSHDGVWLAGAIAYYAAFSVFPLLMVLIAGFGLLARISPGVKDAQAQLLDLVARNTAPQVASQVAAMLADVKLKAGVGGPVGLAVLLLGASGLFAALDGAFDRLWGVPPPKPGILPALRMVLYQRLNAFLMLLALGLLVVAAFITSLGLAAVSQAAAAVPAAQSGWHMAQLFISIGINAFVLAVIYKVLPKPNLQWRDVWFAAVAVAIVWEIGKVVLAWLVIGQNYTPYGVVGAFIALMSWIYYASLLFFVGAEIVQVKCRSRETVGALAPAAASGREWRPVSAAPQQVPGNTGDEPGQEAAGMASGPATGREPQVSDKRRAMKTTIDLLKETFREWGEDKAARLAAALAYYTIFSIAPLLIVIIGVAGLVFGQAAVQGQIVGQIQGLVGAQGANLIQTMIASASKPSSGIIATVIGLVTLLLGASGVFGQLQDSLNTIWEVAPAPGRKIWQVLLARMLTFGMVLVIGFLLLVSLVVSAALSALSGALSSVVPVGIPVVLWQLVDLAISLAVITLLFALIYKFLPDVRISWRYVWIGAAFTSLLFTIGKFLIGLYLGHSGAASAYGAAGSLVVILLWIYYSAQILFLGAEFTQVYAQRHGAQVEAVHGTVKLSEEARVQQGMPRRPRPGAASPPAPKARPSAPAVRRAGPGALPVRARVLAASSTPARGGAKAAAAAAAGAVLFAVVTVTKLGRKS